MLSLWWLGLHGLLAATALLIGWPAPTKVAALCAVFVHALWRKPSSTRAVIEVGADGACRIPAVNAEPFEPDAGTLLTPFCVRIVARSSRDTVDILLLADQVPREDWRRLTAILRRATARRA
ncbi:MAG TPA: protein YgfX [Gammaproteobacteria bacterium]